MPVRTLNYTDRKRIEKGDALITIGEDEGGNFFDADLRLHGYNLPADAHVFVEAYRQTQYMRFDYGQAGARRIPDDRRLTKFDSAKGVLFRVKVVATSHRYGLLLAEADGIRQPKSADRDEISLLPVVPDESLEEEIWRLEFDGHQTLLKVNSTLGDWRALARDPVFSSLVLPSVLRTVLWRVLMQGERPDTEDNDWRSRWLDFAKRLPLVGELPDKGDEEKVEEWIDTAVSEFCRRHKFRASYGRYWKGAQDQ